MGTGIVIEIVIVIVIGGKKIIMEVKKQWYPIIVAPNQEERVKRQIEFKARNLDLQDKIFDVIIPEEKASELKNGKRVPITRKIWPGYIVVQMFYSPEVYRAIRSTVGVSGFVHRGGISTPEPLSEDDVVAMLSRRLEDSSKVISTLKKGSQVRITEGLFAGMSGVVERAREDKVNIQVELFGKEVRMELDSLQVEKR